MNLDVSIPLDGRISLAPNQPWWPMIGKSGLPTDKRRKFWPTWGEALLTHRLSAKARDPRIS